METKINVAAILKDKLENMELYSPICGNCKLDYVYDETIQISFFSFTRGWACNGERKFDKFGRQYNNGECLLFPSKEMRDWSKFAWKKGDVLVNKDGDVYIIFERFSDDTYCSFVGKYYLWKENNDTEHFYKNERLLTSDFQKAGKDAAQTYINTIEERLGGKLNREILEIEKTQPEFKDGDMVSLEIRYIDSEDVIVETYIVHGDYNYGEELNFYAGCNNLDMIKHNSCVKPTNTSVRKVFIRYATDSEKQQLFSALAKEGKAWDAKKKMIVDLKPKVELKPFDKVLCRNSKDDTWEADFFARLTRKEIDYTQSGKYLCVGDLWMYCIPYNEETAHLLGTTDEWKGGEQ